MTTLVLRHHPVPNARKPYGLVVRTHDLASTDYDTVCLVDAETAVAIMRAGRTRFLFSTDDGLTQKAREAGPEGVLTVRWDPTVGGPKEFSLEIVREGRDPVPVAMLGYDDADSVVRTEYAVWDGRHPILRQDYNDEMRRRKVAALRAEADRLERGEVDA